MGERVVDDDEVGGSIPPPPTIFVFGVLQVWDGEDLPTEVRSTERELLNEHIGG